jgi:hypothetical protein
MDNRVVQVVSRSPAGEWTIWRVGRQRLAWRPDRQLRSHQYAFGDYERREAASFEAVSWVGALLSTIVVLPWRIVVNRWPVIAYVSVPMDVPGPARRTRPMPRAAADELVRHWAAHIKEHGLPPEE